MMLVLRNFDIFSWRYKQNSNFSLTENKNTLSGAMIQLNTMPPNSTKDHFSPRMAPIFDNTC